MRDCNAVAEGMVLGLDLGDKKSHYSLLDEQGTVVEEKCGRVSEQTRNIGNTF